MSKFFYSLSASLIGLIIVIGINYKNKKVIFDKEKINTYIGTISLIFVVSYYFIFNTTNINIDNSIIKSNINEPIVPF